MKPDFDYNEIPSGYPLCFNEKCPHSADCLRRRAALLTTGESQFITVVNPLYVIGHEENCTCFRPSRRIRLARGISHLLDDIPHSLAMDIKKILIACFGRNKYYRIYRGERLMDQSEQEYISQLFHSKGIMKEPVFDEYLEPYDW